MTDTPETLQSALDEVRVHVAAVEARVVAFEKAQKAADVEPGPPDCGWPDYIQELHALGFPIAAEWIEWAQAELARLREGLRVQEEDYPDKVIREYCELGNLFAIEIQRHRALVTK